MGLLDWLWRRGESAPGADAHERHGAGVPAGSSSEGPPVGVSDPGALAGDDADEVVAEDEGDELEPA
jgi:hypothetical protein